MKTLINKTEEIGNKFIDEIIVPIAQAGKKIVIENNKYIQAFLTLKTAFLENKISTFLNFYSLLENLDKPLIYKKYYGLPKKLHSDELILSIKKLANLGILFIYNGTFAAEVINSKNDVSAFSLKKR